LHDDLLGIHGIAHLLYKLSSSRIYPVGKEIGVLNTSLFKIKVNLGDIFISVFLVAFELPDNWIGQASQEQSWQYMEPAQPGKPRKAAGKQ
jgi:hypothetical protein